MTTFDSSPVFWAIIRLAQASFAGLLIVALAKAFRLDWTFALAGAKLYQWQTLVAGFLAVFGAMKTVAAVRDQIAQAHLSARELREQTERHEIQSLVRQRRAARAELPAALAQLADYVEACLIFIKSIPLGDGQRIFIEPGGPAISPPPESPKEALAVIRRCVEFAQTESQYDAFASFLERLQIQHSRIHSTMQDIHPPSIMVATRHRLVRDAVDAVEISARISKMWSYARRETEELDKAVTAEEMMSKAFFAHFHEHDYPGLEAAIGSAASVSETWPRIVLPT